MAIQKTLGGDRLGSGKKMQVSLHNFGRSSHNLSTIIKTDQAVGTLVPYWVGIALNGTTHYIDIATKVRTMPTNGPLFGSFKHQIDIFQIPIRLYIGALHNNALGIGLRMEQIFLPRAYMWASKINFLEKTNPNLQQVSKSSLMAYLGISGFGQPMSQALAVDKQCVPLLAYWDIYKNYYANKQEENGYAIATKKSFLVAAQLQKEKETEIAYDVEKEQWPQEFTAKPGDGQTFLFQVSPDMTVSQAGQIEFVDYPTEGVNTKIQDIMRISKEFNGQFRGTPTVEIHIIPEIGEMGKISNMPTITMPVSFPLKNIDTMREEILAAPKTAPFYINQKNSGGMTPYSFAIDPTVSQQDTRKGAQYFDQAGLGLRTYLSDRFNNWLSTEWIDGENGINEITAVTITDNKLTMDSLIFQKKLYEMMNRIAISGGSYNDWQEAVYGEKTIRMAESPIYCGGLSSEIVFDEVVSTAEADTGNGTQPLGSLAGRGSDRINKGGRGIKIKTDEPSIIMVIGSIVPRIDYSQGNEWWTELETMDDFHKPSLDGIGFQELMTDEFAAWTKTLKSDGTVTRLSVGKQPAWIEYMTNVNKSYGSFVAGGELDFMAVNREYHAEIDGSIVDATTYIDPRDYNKDFADQGIGAKNFWIQVAMDITARRKMSATQIPNL